MFYGPSTAFDIGDAVSYGLAGIHLHTPATDKEIDDAAPQ